MQFVRVVVLGLILVVLSLSVSTVSVHADSDLPIDNDVCAAFNAHVISLQARVPEWDSSSVTYPDIRASYFPDEGQVVSPDQIVTGNIYAFVNQDIYGWEFRAVVGGPYTDGRSQFIRTRSAERDAQDSWKDWLDVAYLSDNGVVEYYTGVWNPVNFILEVPKEVVNQCAQVPYTMSTAERIEELGFVIHVLEQRLEGYEFEAASLMDEPEFFYEGYQYELDALSNRVEIQRLRMDQLELRTQILEHMADWLNAASTSAVPVDF